MQFFFIKLDMRFNDHIEGPGNDHMRKLFLCQRGLTPLKKLLTREEYHHVVDITALAIRYRFASQPQFDHLPMFGVPPEEIGTGHLEGWGKGRVHLMRPNELVVRESVRGKLGMML